MPSPSPPGEQLDAPALHDARLDHPLENTNGDPILYTSPTSSPQQHLQTTTTMEETPRGRLKRRRPSPSPSRFRSPSPSRHSTHSISPPPSAKKKTLRRRSDAEPDHTLRGRARNRSQSRRRTKSPILEGEEKDVEGSTWVVRKRSPPPSRHTSGSRTGMDKRRQRSLPNQYREVRVG